MLDQLQFRNEDVVLRVSPSIDPTRFDTDRYEAFIDALCGTREYQKEAIRSALRFFLGDRYRNLRELAEENYRSSTVLRERYNTFRELENHLQFPDKLSCSVDLATSTGKSFVMYGIARIMLAHGAVDRVLVLCPSRTIKHGLTEKFRQLSGDSGLRSLLPDDVHIPIPHVINATESIVAGSICIENFHATLEHVKSSVRDSLEGKGDRTLVLNDEAHHIYSPGVDTLKKWKSFLEDDAFNFRYLAGFSGTCYIGNEYFADVITRYSLRQAIEEGYAKSIEYVAEDTSPSQNEKFQKIYDNHIQNKTQLYRKVKPLTILITKNIAACRRLTEDLVEFLAHYEGIDPEDAHEKILIVTSSHEHLNNARLLDTVDRSDNPVEWITSVSMLTEGWDVQNVFQIVPHEERAFNSKLLIAQVLGRGLRIPDAYRGERPVLTVFNHDAWSGRIRHLVDEIMEVERRAYSYPVLKDPDHNFTLYNIDYSKTQEIEETIRSGEYEFTKGYITLVSQAFDLERETVYSRIGSGDRRQKRTIIRYPVYAVSEVAEHIHNKLRAIDIEEGTGYSTKYDVPWLLEIIRESLKRVGEHEDRVSDVNRQRLQKAFGVVHRKANQSVRYRMKPTALVTVGTAGRRRDSIGVSSLRKSDATIFMDENSVALSDEETGAILEVVLEDETLPRSAIQVVENSFVFKTPLNVAITDHKPERDFVRRLVRLENASAVESWIKSTDQDFYPIEYAWRKGEHAKRGFFNPDFFIKIGSHYLVVEIKGDEEITDPSDENKAKHKAASQHFATLNDLQTEHTYHFNFLTPRDYDVFFQFVRESKFEFRSKVDAALAENGL